MMMDEASPVELVESVAAIVERMYFDDTLTQAPAWVAAKRAARAAALERDEVGAGEALAAEMLQSGDRVVSRDRAKTRRGAQS